MGNTNRPQNTTVEVRYTDSSQNDFNTSIRGFSEIDNTKPRYHDKKFSEDGYGDGIPTFNDYSSSDNIELHNTELTNEAEVLLRKMFSDFEKGLDTGSAIVIQKDNSGALIKRLEYATVKSDLFNTNISSDNPRPFLITFIGRFTQMTERSSIVKER